LVSYDTLWHIHQHSYSRDTSGTMLAARPKSGAIHPAGTMLDVGEPISCCALLSGSRVREKLLLRLRTWLLARVMNVSFFICRSLVEIWKDIPSEWGAVKRGQNSAEPHCRRRGELPPFSTPSTSVRQFGISLSRYLCDACLTNQSANLEGYRLTNVRLLRSGHGIEAHAGRQQS
jgi:hypothetical protein